MTWWRVGPWLTPVLVVVEVVLVSSGLVTLRDSLAVVIAIEAALAATAITRAPIVAKHYRSGKADGLDGWAAAEDALARLMPRRLARLVTLEPRLFVCLIRWLTGRHDARSPTSATYHRSARLLFVVIIALVVVEGAPAELLLRFLVPHGPWLWLALALHLYGVLWLAAGYASLVVRPHRLHEDALVVRDGVLTELVIPYTTIRDVRVDRKPNLGRSGLRIDATGTAILAFGDATVAIEPTTGERFTKLHITVDDPARFIAKLTRHRTVSRQREPNGGEPDRGAAPPERTPPTTHKTNRTSQCRVRTPRSP